MCCNTNIVLQAGRLGWLVLYRNTIDCIVTGLRRKGWAVLQYNTASLRHGQLARGTVPTIRLGWRAASAHDTAARATIRQARRAGGGGGGGRHVAWRAA